MATRTSSTSRKRSTSTRPATRGPAARSGARKGGARSGGLPLPLHPLIGGLPPEVAWRYLRTVADEVMPAL